MTFNSNPAGANIEIVNRAGNVVFSGNTPTTITLSAGAGFFRGERYVVRATLNDMTGTATLSPAVDGWYVGNILFGGLIGLLIVDPATGAMYRLPKSFEVPVSTPVADTQVPKLKIVDIADISDDMRNALIPVD